MHAIVAQAKLTSIPVRLAYSLYSFSITVLRGSSQTSTLFNLHVITVQQVIFDGEKFSVNTHVAMHTSH